MLELRGISDPGEEIVKKAIAEEIDIVPIPGACALINALISSGLNTKQFTFYGFLPMNKKLRKRGFEKIEKENKTLIIYEAPHKLQNTLAEVIENVGDINCVVAKELTKMHETFFRGKISELITTISEPKGEYIILLDLNDRINEEETIEDRTIEEQYEIYQKQGLEKKEIIKRIAKNKKVAKNEIYQMFIEKK